MLNTAYDKSDLIKVCVFKRLRLFHLISHIALCSSLQTNDKSRFHNWKNGTTRRLCSTITEKKKTSPFESVCIWRSRLVSTESPNNNKTIKNQMCLVDAVHKSFHVTINTLWLCYSIYEHIHTHAHNLQLFLYVSSFPLFLFSWIFVLWNCWTVLN